MRSDGALAALVGARCFVEAVLFSALAALAHAIGQGRDPMPVLPTAFALFGAALLLVTLLKETGTERRSATIMIVTLGAGIAWGLALPTAGADAFGVFSRMVLFGLVSEAFLWRVVSIARGATRWTDARNTIPLTGIAIAIAVLVPIRIDREPFAGLALLALAASGLALSLARSTEELELARGTVGKLRTSSATSVTVVIGVVAIAVAAVVPAVQDVLGALGAALAPLFGRILYLLILPFALAAGYLIEFLRPLVSGRFVWPTPSIAQITPEQDREMMRQIEQSRPYLVGAIELFVVAIAVLVGIVLFDRMLRERRQVLPEGVTLEREPAGGIGLRDTLRSLRPRRATRARPPRDDGTAAGAIRVAYWRFLAAAERSGAGWRAMAETPLEHEQRIADQDARWRAAGPVVRAFEDVRYGEVEPDAATVGRAREAVKSLEVRPR